MHTHPCEGIQYERCHLHPLRRPKFDRFGIPASTPLEIRGKNQYANEEQKIQGRPQDVPVHGGGGEQTRRTGEGNHADACSYIYLRALISAVRYAHISFEDLEVRSSEPVRACSRCHCRGPRKPHDCSSRTWPVFTIFEGA